MSWWILAAVACVAVYRFGQKDVQRFLNDRAGKAGNAMLRRIQSGEWSTTCERIDRSAAPFRRR